MNIPVRKVYKNVEEFLFEPYSKNDSVGFEDQFRIFRHSYYFDDTPAKPGQLSLALRFYTEEPLDSVTYAKLWQILKDLVCPYDNVKNYSSKYRATQRLLDLETNGSHGTDGDEYLTHDRLLHIIEEREELPL